MEAAPSVKPRRVSPRIPPNYVSLRQLQELRLKEKEEQEKRRREEEEAVAAAAAKLEATRKAEMKAIAATVKAQKKVSAASSVASGWAKERRDGGRGHQWVAVAHQPAREEGLFGKREGATGGAGRGKKGPADAAAAKAPRGGGKQEGKAKGAGEEKASAVTSAQILAADVPGKPPAEASSREGKPENRGEGKAKEKASGDKSAEPDSIGASGESARASSRRRRYPQWKKGAGGRSAEVKADTAPAKTAAASPPQGVNPEAAGKPTTPGPRLADASPSTVPSEGKKAAPRPPTSAAAGRSGVELRAAVETKTEGLAEGSAVVVHVAADQKPRVVRRWTEPRPPGDRRNGTAEQHGRIWVPKTAAAGCAEPSKC